ncbi:hypothetical protein Leryth_023602 [Lithospermum erythrorhizon]|uniref:MADS-box domain-containing protein n=1 Tax=Lithospermum erythrorhizon TaxID=34254 RepID=A0AAV3RK11_LITER|nr:hypothetical protein Leryth_023602 [Lithospermum erythrorhizon]
MEKNIVKKQSLGRQKIEIKKISKKTKLQVSFTKRRKGLFNKVAELHKVCGVNAAVFVESPGGKPFSFGTPSTQYFINHYLNNISSQNIVTAEVNHVSENKLSVEEFWWSKSINDLGLQELEEFKEALEDFKSNIMAKAN